MEISGFVRLLALSHWLSGRKTSLFLPCNLKQSDYEKIFGVGRCGAPTLLQLPSEFRE
jgi:hypothetical protein